MSSLSQALHLDSLPSSHSAFQDHAAHSAGWPACLDPTAHEVPVYPKVLPHSSVMLHGAQWVGSGRVTLRHVSPTLPLDPYVRLSPHTAHERGILWDISISPAPRHIHRGQLYAFAGYLCTLSLPSPSGPSPCAQLSCAPTTMPHLTACRASEFRMGLPTSTLHPP